MTPTAALSAALDTIWVVLFVAIGRHTHDHGDTVAGILSTSWPFLVGLGVGWLLVRAWRAPTALAPTGVVIWLGAALLGMVVRVLAGQGTALAFIGVTLAFLGLGLLGWRAGVGLIRSRLHRSTPSDR